MDIGAIIGLAVSGVGGVVWGIRQEGRVNQLEKARETDLKHADERHADIKQTLLRMDNKIDDLFTVLIKEMRINGHSKS